MVLTVKVRSLLEKTLLELMYEVPGGSLSAGGVNLENLDDPEIISAQTGRRTA